MGILNVGTVLNAHVRATDIGVKDIINKGNKDRKKGVFHPSGVGYCLRKLFFDAKASQEILTDLDARTSRIFVNGHYSHERYVAELIHGSFSKSFWATDTVAEIRVYTSDDNHGLRRATPEDVGNYNEITLYNKEYNIYGHCDIFAEAIGTDGSSEYYVIENKTINKSGFDWCAGDTTHKKSAEWSEKMGIVIAGDAEDIDPKYPTPNGPKPEHYAQIQMYMFLLTEMGYPCNIGIVMYESKDTQHRMLYGVKKDDRFIEMLLDKVKRYNEAVNSGCAPIADCESDRFLRYLVTAMRENELDQYKHRRFDKTKRHYFHDCKVCKGRDKIVKATINAIKELCGTFGIEEKKVIGRVFSDDVLPIKVANNRLYYDKDGYAPQKYRMNECTCYDSYKVYVCPKCNTIEHSFRCEYCQWKNNKICLNELMLRSYAGPIKCTSFSLFNYVLLNHTILNMTFGLGIKAAILRVWSVR